MSTKDEENFQRIENMNFKKRYDTVKICHKYWKEPALKRIIGDMLKLEGMSFEKVKQIIVNQWGESPEEFQRIVEEINN
ncbi:hypothetical protein ISS37_07470 [candidate division KSB1 bacterium]|nr:hypothetical protein [candidate division KSB1 bacterium]